MGKTDEGYRKFKVSFHFIILSFAIGLIISTIVGFNDMERASLYLILGILFAGESIFGLYKNFNRRVVMQEENSNHF
ncbi:hypothetical protein [Lentibacillus sp. Marseille-P4043]|uniref:hypothetical protein n=1 Tax=Lentibacillus sp. Marseille-P4043 TaxID=2040293 RepID=UPI000D0B49CC|nr:hypothetical protein [Lentibacillus sp. Marseille-P4043]